jgi:hypothetical protein
VKVLQVASVVEAPTATACLLCQRRNEEYLIEEMSINCLVSYLLLHFDSFSGASEASTCSLVVGPIFSLAFAAAVAHNAAGSARAQLDRFAAIGGEYEAVLVAALEHALPAVHFPCCFGGKFLVCCIDMRLKRLQQRERVRWKLRVYISKRVKMAQAFPK